jgi:hypothetical protein
MSYYPFDKLNPNNDKINSNNDKINSNKDKINSNKDKINSNKDKFNPTNFLKKERFYDTTNKDFFYDTPGFWQYNNKADFIDNESDLKKPCILTKQKTKMELNNILHPNNYEIPVSNVLKSKKDNKMYLHAYDTSPGRGFGNLNVSNTIRLGDNTRLETRNNKVNKEGTIIERWDFIDNRFQNPNHVVMPMIRGGESTRKSEETFSSEMGSKFEFEY